MLGSCLFLGCHQSVKERKSGVGRIDNLTDRDPRAGIGISTRQGGTYELALLKKASNLF
jgi:hypothetical protein